jgi:hypothetical protein
MDQSTVGLNIILDICFISFNFLTSEYLLNNDISPSDNLYFITLLSINKVNKSVLITVTIIKTNKSILKITNVINLNIVIHLNYGFIKKHIRIRKIYNK